MHREEEDVAKEAEPMEEAQEQPQKVPEKDTGKASGGGKKGKKGKKKDDDDWYGEGGSHKYTCMVRFPDHTGRIKTM